PRRFKGQVLPCANQEAGYRTRRRKRSQSAGTQREIAGGGKKLKTASGFRKSRRGRRNWREPGAGSRFQSLDSGKPAGVPGTAVTGVPGVQVRKTADKDPQQKLRRPRAGRRKPETGSVVGIQT